ncbi:MFS transporter [Phaeodactylibacter luteus]|uniref:TCR/Tet family MFS transporter n=1 Tax=Phaeodactylibacter luteus TaxID=1564516 RepID=A0A5C6S743_9BACT|nr:MFS transporter [Phaeodactylibacter luteus]TXB70219.1 TCR/Tet family MFS transporter [Phaeodactylibacter luteus]
MRQSPLLVLFVTIFIDLLGFGLIIPILPIYANELGASGAEIGLVAASFSFMQFLIAPFWGNLSDRMGRKPILLISILITGIGYLVFAHAATLSLLFLARIVAGIGSANISAAQAYISDITPPDKRARAFGIIGAAFGLGFIFGPPLGGFLKSAYGIASVGYTAAAFCGANLLMAYFLLGESLKEPRKAAGPLFENPLADYRYGLGKPVIGELLTINFIFIAAFSLMTVSVALLWEEHYGLSEAQVGYTFAFLGVVTAIVQGGLVGWASRTFGDRKLLVAGYVLMFVGLTALPFIPVSLFIPLELLAIVVIALGNGALTPTITSLLSKAAGEGEQGRILGLGQSVSSLGRVIGPFLGGWLYGLHYQLPYLGSGALMIVCLLLAVRLIQRRLSPPAGA